MPVLTLDPLRVAGDAVAIALDYVRSGRPACLGISTMPIIGLSSPITLLGAFVENIATVLGTLALFKMMGVKNEMIFHKVFSAEQLLLDVEILNHVRVLASGFDFSEETLAVEAIREVGPGGSFITHPSTIERHRKLHVSRFFENISPETWATREKKPLTERLRSEARRIIAAHDFGLEEGAQRELDLIYQAFVDSVRV